jgi:hypothetical protein
VPARSTNSKPNTGFPANVGVSSFGLQREQFDDRIAPTLGTTASIDRTA